LMMLHSPLQNQSPSGICGSNTQYQHVRYSACAVEQESAHAEVSTAWLNILGDTSYPTPTSAAAEVAHYSTSHRTCHIRVARHTPERCGPCSLLTSFRSALLCSRRQPTWNSRSQVSQMMMVRSPKAPRRKSGSWHSTQPLPRPSVSCTTSGGLRTSTHSKHPHQGSSIPSNVTG
jgi:hypothetical protein